MTRRNRTTDTAIKIVRTLPTAVKVVLASAAILGTLYGGVRFVVDVEFSRHEKAQQKIGRQEFTKYKDGIEKRLDKIDSRIDRVDERARNR